MTSHTAIKRVEVLGIPFDACTMDQALERVECLLNGDTQTTISFSNPEFLVAAQKSSFLRTYLTSTALNLADGIGVVKAAAWLGSPLPERITGTDFTYRLAECSAEKGYRIYLLGGKPGIAEMAAERLRSLYPGCSIVGTHHGYFLPDTCSEVVSAINDKQPDVLMVCLGNPRQEEWIEGNRKYLKAKLIFGNGGSLDFTSGVVKRAPRVFQKLSAEWLWRLLQDFNLRRIRRQLKLISFVHLAAAQALRSRYERKKRR